jgi:hypothetical protein
MDDSFFSQVNNDNIVARYYDWLMMAASFEAPAANAARFLPSKALKPVQTAPDLTTITLMAMAYRQIDALPPYNEFGVLMPVVYEDDVSEEPVYWVVTLPVTTPEARDAGVMLYGYPKFVADIAFEHDGVASRCRVEAEGQAIISFEVAHEEMDFQSFGLCTYTIKDNNLLKTRIQIQGEVGPSQAIGGARFMLGDHPMAEKLRMLEMSPVSVGHQYAPELQSILYLAEPVGVIEPLATV